ncbi:hypothetical protein, partial [Mycobacterium heckeshornense]|uniref:hypothetical protein n=1 Tax=Mycobacterium heckeshornense TaxID=110505 RepID=UPI0021F34682
MDLPWSMWAMMQKFRICAGAVKVWSAKLLMGILTFLAGWSLPLAVGFELPRGVGYGFHGFAVGDGRRRLAAR